LFYKNNSEPATLFRYRAADGSPVGGGE